MRVGFCELSGRPPFTLYIQPPLYTKPTRSTQRTAGRLRPLLDLYLVCDGHFDADLRAEKEVR